MGNITEEFKSGTFISAEEIKENGEYPVYGGNGLRGYSNTYNHDGEFALIGRQGALCGNVNYSTGKAYFTEHAVAVKANKTANIRFLYYLLDKMDLGQYSDQSAQPGLAVGKLIKLKNKFPSRQEQDKIGQYFERIDNLITLHQREYFSQFENINRHAYPWEQRKLSHYLDVSTEKNVDNNYTKDDVLSVSGDYGIVNQIEFKGRSFAGESVSYYGIVKSGDVVYTKSPLNSNPFGIIKANKGKAGIVSTLYAIYHPKNNVVSNFIQNYFEQNARVNNYLHPLVNKGAKNDMKVSSENALKGIVVFPGLYEQTIISSMFAKLDNLITLHQRE